MYEVSDSVCGTETYQFFLKIYFFIILNLCVCNAYRVQNVVSDTLVLKLEATVNFQTWESNMNP